MKSNKLGHVMSFSRMFSFIAFFDGHIRMDSQHVCPIHCFCSGSCGQRNSLPQRQVLSKQENDYRKERLGALFY